MAHPKRVDENTQCQQVVTAADASAATGATVTPGLMTPFLCHYEVKTENSRRGLLAISFFGDPTFAPSAVTTSLAGNPAVEQRNGVVVCTFFIVLDGKKRLDTKGAALSVTADLRDPVDPCKVARELAEKGFARLPDA